MNKKYTFLFIFLICILFYTRFVNMGWGLPYPMHPDERNMANAVQSLHCDTLHATLRQASGQARFALRDCLNPHFFAYGQFPLYLAYVGILIFHILLGINSPITFEEATLALRIISSIATILNVFVLFKIVENVLPKQRFTFHVTRFALLIFSPYFIQFSHFGTTESLLMLFYSLIILLSLRLVSIAKKGSFSHSSLSTNDYRLSTFHLLSFTSGLALATKISSVVFLFVPLISIFISHWNKQQVAEMKGVPKARTRRTSIPFRLRARGALAGMKSLTESVVLFMIISIISSLIFSPHNLISFKDFFSSFQYESSVALGKYIAFYTRQFVDSIPVWFQLNNIFPYVLGWPQYILFILGFVFLSWKNIQINLLRLSFLLFFIPNAFVFAKWTRFMAPIFPVMSVFAILFIIQVYEKLKVKNQKSKVQVKNQKFLLFNLLPVSLTFAFCLLTCLPGIAYLSIYTSPDVRFTASDWIYKHIPANAKILSETANVIDLPIQSPINLQPSTFNSQPSINYQYVSFDFYHLDTDTTLQNKLAYFVKSADYIFIPSRRIVMNHLCIESRRWKIDDRNDKCIALQKQYPLLHDYYEQLFNGEMGFKKVAEFSSYPKIQIFGKTIVEFPDEDAEESFSVFDHPVIRIYKRVDSRGSRVERKNQEDNILGSFQDYKTITYQLPTNDTSNSHSVNQQPTTFHLLIADIPLKWEKGLMYVRSKEDINGLDGMLFRFPTSEMRTFWNKNTISDLRLYWINKDKIVGISDLPSIEKSKNIITVASPSEVNQVIELIQE